MPLPKSWSRVLALTALAVASLPLAGCGLLAANQYAQAVPVSAQYNGFDGKKVAIVVYTMPATVNEFSGSREEITDFIANEMRLHLPTTNVLDRRAVIRWQDNTINWYGLSETDIGKHFGVDRVLSVQILDYSTRKLIGYSDLQGRLRAQCKVVEIQAADTARTGSVSWTGIVDVTWPKDRPLDPTQTNDNAVRQRVLELFSQRLVKYFYDHLEQRGGEGMRAN